MATTRPLEQRQHWVQEERLRAVMGELARTQYAWPKDMPDDPEAGTGPAENSFPDAAGLAAGLAAAAGRISASVSTQPMADADRRGFEAEALRLRGAAIELKSAAEARRIEPMQKALDKVNSSCIACHSRYRDFAGELGARRAGLDLDVQNSARRWTAPAFFWE